MLNVAELRAAMVKKGYTQKTLANALGISERTMGNRISRRSFGTDEIEKMISILEISDPMPIFFDGAVTSKATQSRKG